MPNFEVDLPAGGKLTLDNAEEEELWNESAERFLDDYGISRQNDKIHVGAILSQQLAMFRAQRDLMIPSKASAAQSMIAKCSSEIRDIEKLLGVDKKSREAGGKHTTADYLKNVKLAAHKMGVKISDRVKAYERFNMALRTKIRILRNADDEDKAYENVSPESILAWAEQELAALEDNDKKWARDNGAIFVGRL